jgi:polar amino acid transport system permease protein
VVYARIFMFRLGIGRFTSAFLIEEVESGLAFRAGRATGGGAGTGFSAWRLFRYILLPQGWLTPGSPSSGSIST